MVNIQPKTIAIPYDLIENIMKKIENIEDEHTMRKLQQIENNKMTKIKDKELEIKI